MPDKHKFTLLKINWDIVQTAALQNSPAKVQGKEIVMAYPPEDTPKRISSRKCRVNYTMETNGRTVKKSYGKYKVIKVTFYQPLAVVKGVVLEFSITPRDFCRYIEKSLGGLPDNAPLLKGGLVTGTMKMPCLFLVECVK